MLRRMVAVVARALAGVLGAVARAWETELERTYKEAITVGMSLAEVEDLLGPGTHADGPPSLRPALHGDEFYYWYHSSGFQVWLGFRDKRVCEKWSYEITL